MYNKYRNIKTEIDGIVFDSKKEAAKYCELKMRVKCEDLIKFERQVPFIIMVNNTKICTYYADFVTYSKAGIREVLDVKGVKTQIYRLKKKLIKALYNIDIIDC